MSVQTGATGVKCVVPSMSIGPQPITTFLAVGFCRSQVDFENKSLFSHSFNEQTILDCVVMSTHVFLVYVLLVISFWV